MTDGPVDDPCYALADLNAPPGKRIILMWPPHITKEQAEAAMPSIIARLGSAADRDFQLVHCTPAKKD